MPRNGTGTYTAPASTWNPGVNGVTATTADFNGLLTDVSAAITQSVSSDGQTPMTGNLPMGNNKITGLALGTANTDGASVANLQNAVGQAGSSGFRNLLINANGAINQRGYVSGAATTVANQYTLDRWRVVTSGQNLTFGSAAPGRTLTAPAGGVEQVIEAAAIEGGVYTLSWTGSATATVNGSPITSGGNTASLPANTAVTVRFINGTVANPQFEPGTVATPFSRIDPAVEMVKCMRRFQAIKGTAPIAPGGWTQSATAAVSCCLRFQRMASAPTAIPINGTYTLFDGSIQANVTTLNTSFSTEDSMGFDIVAAGGMTAGRPGLLYVSTGALWLSAEL